ncbi:hypothetical protein [Winogradskyella jejuensis]|uniref:Lipocalin-like domain-containing protein n=1 Tax=Winogradskyella jejuensis TaxID=1089305 RepID=A0A1M5K996_9FLAO|nr:hypothetical protein [Winogradskyella jejuensis]SHG49069.1 hypothetical protein SAMN05444148_0258 [Winogradskyella jejuensis]
MAFFTHFFSELQLRFLIVILIISVTYSCKAQQVVDNQQQINIYSSQIIGIWIDDKDDYYKLEFLSNGICKEYDENQMIAEYNYSIVNSNCSNYNSSNSFFLQWIDSEDSRVTCLEILNITDTNLSLMIIDKAERLFFNKQ